MRQRTMSRFWVISAGPYNIAGATIQALTMGANSSDDQPSADG